MSLSFRNRNIEKIITNGLREALGEVVYNSFRGRNSTKSSKRTDSLHEMFKRMIKDSIEPTTLNKRNIKIKTDISKSKTGILDGWGKNISCDLIIEENETKNEILMLKAPMFSINKNFHNSLNNAHGEAVRILLPDENDTLHIHSINLIPTRAPLLNSDKNTIVSWENIKRFSKEKYNLSKFGALGERFNYFNIYYSLNAKLYETNTKEETFKMINELINNKEEIVFFDEEDLNETFGFFEGVQNKYNKGPQIAK